MREQIKHTARTVHRHITRHTVGWVIFLLLSAIIAAQLKYPLDRAVPFARLGDQAVGYQLYDSLAEKVNQQFLDSKATLFVNERTTLTFSPRQAGAEPLLEATVNRLTDYPLWQRLIPLSILWQTPQVRSVDVTINRDRLGQFVEANLAKFNTPARNAGLAIKDGQLVMTDDIPGTEVRRDDVHRVLAEASYGLVSTTVKVPSRTVSAEKPRTYFEAVKHQAETVIALPIVITADAKTFQPSHAQIADWLAIGERDGRAALVVNDAGLDAYLAQLAKETETATGVTHVSRVDGRAVSRQEGQPGRKADTSKLKQQITAIIESGQNATLTATFVPVPPTVVINKKYSSTQAGLQAYLDDQATSRNVRITVQQIGGAGWSAGARGSESTVSASTYKLYVALYLFNQMEQGTLRWEDPILDTNVRGCMERMLVASTNACAEEWLRQYGDGAVERYAWSRGFSRGTQFTNPEANHTTTDDLTRFMRGLNDGSLLGGHYREYLLSALIRHPYRKGIPGGSNGEVHNKVGFLWDYSNDSAIVYHPRGTYVIAVMTKGLSFYAIAGITREIEAIMYP